MAVKLGCKVPAFRAPSTGGGELSSRDLVGRATVLFFYPKDSTSG